MYDGYEGQIVAMLAREARVVLLEGPKKGEECKFKYNRLHEVNKKTPTIAQALRVVAGAPTAAAKKEAEDQKVMDAESVLGVFGDLLVSTVALADSRANVGVG